MKKPINGKVNEKGFSLVELLLVVVIIGIIAAVAVPNLQRATRAAENGTTFSTMRTVASSQVGFYSQNGRFGRIGELNNLLGNGLGTDVPPRLVRGKFTFEMAGLGGPTPTDADLRNEYTITATRTVLNPGDVVYKYELTQTGEIRQILPLPLPTP